MVYVYECINKRIAQNGNTYQYLTMRIMHEGREVEFFLGNILLVMVFNGLEMGSTVIMSKKRKPTQMFVCPVCLHSVRLPNSRAEADNSFK